VRCVETALAAAIGVLVLLADAHLSCLRRAGSSQIIGMAPPMARARLFAHSGSRRPIILPDLAPVRRGHKHYFPVSAAAFTTIKLALRRGDFQKMRACGKAARPVHDIICQILDTPERNASVDFSAAEPRRRLPHAALGETRGQFANCQPWRCTLFCLLPPKLVKGTILRPWVQPLDLTDCKSEEFPILVAPSGRNGEARRKLARGFEGATTPATASPTPCNRAAASITAR